MEIFSDTFRIMPGLLLAAFAAALLANSVLLLALKRKNRKLDEIIRSGMKTCYMQEEV